MDWIPVVLALGVLGVVGLIFGILLEVADKKLAVEVDPRISKVGEALGGANCGACGYAGLCRAGGSNSQRRSEAECLPRG